MRRILPLPLLLLLATLFPAPAQSLLARSELGPTVGGMNYLGDLNNQSMFGQVNPAAGLTARINLDPRWAISMGATYGHISGGNPDVIAHRNLSFRSPIYEAWVRAEFNFFPYGLRPGTQRRYTPFIFCGFAVFRFNPMAEYQGVWYDLQPLATEGQGTLAYPERQRYKLIETAMPFGLGLRYRINAGMHLALEYGWRLTRTDYLDDISTTYAGAAVLGGEDGGGEMAVILADRTGEVDEGFVNAVGIKRGDDSLDDWYAYFNLSLTISTEILFGWMRGKTCEIK